MNTHEQGTRYEERAARFLTEAGYRLLKRNYRTRFGEVDIIAMDGSYLVFVEVKHRKNARCQHPAEAVGIRKQARICRCALMYINEMHFEKTPPVRFDVLAILGEQVTLYKNAFDFVNGF